jgi:hypothetical protein
LCKRFDIPSLVEFSANVTASRQDSSSIFISGSLRALVKNIPDGEESDLLEAQFDTTLLDNSGRGGGEGL